MATHLHQDSGSELELDITTRDVEKMLKSSRKFMERSRTASIVCGVCLLISAGSAFAHNLPYGGFLVLGLLFAFAVFRAMVGVGIEFVGVAATMFYRMDRTALIYRTELMEYRQREKD